MENDSDRKMKLRDCLKPPPLDTVLVCQLARLADELNGCNPQLRDCAGLLARFNAQAQTSLRREDFHFSGAIDSETFVRQVLTPSPRKIDDITYDELLELVTRIVNADGDEHELRYWLELVEANVPDYRVAELIYWPDQYFGAAPLPEDLTPRAILDIALAAQPSSIILGSASSEAP